MDVVIVTSASAKEIAALVLAVQGRQKVSLERRPQESERESLIRQYESEVSDLTRRLERLKAGASPGDVIF